MENRLNGDENGKNTNPVITAAAIGVDGVEFWDEDDDLWVRNEAVLSDRPSSSSMGVCWPDEDDSDADSRMSSFTLSLVRICSSIWIFNMVAEDDWFIPLCTIQPNYTLVASQSTIFDNWFAIN